MEITIKYLLSLAQLRVHSHCLSQQQSLIFLLWAVAVVAVPMLVQAVLVVD